MKVNWNKQRATNIAGYIIFIMILFGNFFIGHDFYGKYALFTKGYQAFEFLLVGIFFLVYTINTGLRLIKEKKTKVVKMLIIIMIAFASIYLLLQGVRNIPAISRDIIEGKYSTSFEVSDKSKIIDKKIGKSEYFISGTTRNGTEITFEVNDSIYNLFTKFYMDKKIEIDYWNHTKTLCSWSESED